LEPIPLDSDGEPDNLVLAAAECMHPSEELA